MKYANIKLIAAAILASSAAGYPAMAADILSPASAPVQNEQTGQEVTVTGERETKPADTPASVTVITADDIKKNNFQDMKEVLQTVPGFIIQDMRGGMATIGVRTSSQMGGISQPRILIDGMPGILANLDMKQVEKIEIIRGPNSVLYGGNANGGVIKITLKKGSNKEKIKTAVETGGFNQQVYNFSMQDSLEKYDYSMAIKTSRRDGYQPNAFVMSNADSFKLNYYLDDTTKLYVNLGGHPLSVTRNPGMLTRAQYEANYMQSPLLWAYNAFYGGRYAAGYNKELSDTQNLTFDVGYNSGNNEALNTSGTNASLGYYSVSANSAIDTKLIYTQKNFMTPDSQLTSGIEYGSAQTDSVQKQAPNGVISPASTSLSTFSYTKPLAIYVQDDISFGKQIKLTIGGRYDNVGYDTSDRLTATNFTKTYDSFSPKATLNYRINDNSNFYATYANAFTFPTGTQLFRGNGSTLPNANLSPELANNYEIGYKLGIKNFNLAATVFNMNVNNSIVVVTDPVTLVGRYDNAASARYTGLELSTDYKFTPEWSTSLAYTLEDAKFINYKTTTSAGVPVDYSGKSIVAIPTHNATLGFKYSSGKFTASMLNKYNGGYYSGADNAVFYPGQLVSDLTLSYITPAYEFFISGKNIFNARYISYISSSGLNENIIPGDPVSVMVGTTFKF